MTLSGGGGLNEVSHRLLLVFKMLFLMLLGVKVFVIGQDYATKDTFLLVHLTFQSNLGLKIWGGGQKSAKKCHVLFEWPLTSYEN